MAKALSKYDLDTPALLIDIDELEYNIRTMAEYFKTVPSELRPHMKTHKLPIITHMQINAGAIGVTCQKLSEAAVFAQAGIKNILVANQIANQEKIRRFAGLSRWADITVGVDDLGVAKQISEAAVAYDTIAQVAIEVEMVRCGLPAGEPALNFVKKLVQLPNIKFKGMWVHEAGDISAEKSWEKRKTAHYRDLNRFLETKHMVEKAGIPVEMFSAGYTATYDMTATYPEITDVQAGSYVFMDWPYRQLEGLDKFHIALTVLTTIISKPPQQKEIAYTDCGIKNIAAENTADYTEIVFPRLKGELSECLCIDALSEEHGHLRGDVSKVKIGEKIEFIPAHCCTTPPRYDVAYVVSGEKVIDTWAILARGSHS